MPGCFAVRYPLSAVLRSQLPATSYRLQAAGLRIICIDNLYCEFK
jgi:hypothetical protein